MSNRSFIHFLIIALISLAITFVVFDVLQSVAEGQGKFIGGTIQYGGALAGYIALFSLLFTAYNKIGKQQERTEIDLGGQWSLRQTKENGGERVGQARIYQRKGNPRLEITGEMQSTTTPPSISFQSLVGVLHHRRFVFLYENSRREIGIALGDIVDNKPTSFTIAYYDVVNSDTNQDPEGRIKFTRTKN